MYSPEQLCTDPARNISRWKRAAGTEPVSQGEVQETDSAISELDRGGGSPQSTFMAFKAMPTETPLHWHQDQPSG